MPSAIVVIVGGGQAGSEAAFNLRRAGYLGRIVLVGEERGLPYQRPPLSKAYLAGGIPDECLAIRDRAAYIRNNIELRSGVRAKSLRTRDRTLQLDNGETLAFDHLIMATGSRPRPLKVVGAEHPRVGHLRTLPDALFFQKRLRPKTRLGIIGGGYIGLEVAAMASRMGVDVTLIESEQHLMQRVTGPEVGNFYARLHRDNGVDVQVNTVATKIEGRPNAPVLLLDSGRRIEVDAVLASVGSEPAIDLAVEAGLVCNGGIVVDEYCQSSIPYIYAIGDCAVLRSELYGCHIRLESVSNALDQASRVAVTICGRRDERRYVPLFWTDQYEVTLQTAGLRLDFDRVVVRGNIDGPSFAVFYLRKAQLMAVDAINRPSEFSLARAWIADGSEISAELLADDSTPASQLAA